MTSPYPKYFLLAFILLLLGAGLYSIFAPARLPPEWEKQLGEQSNPFTVPADSSDFVWSRALAYLRLHRNRIVGGQWQVNDSLIYIPYSNGYHRGNSLKVSRVLKGDSVIFRTEWWYSGYWQENGAREIALYMRKGISRYDY